MVNDSVFRVVSRLLATLAAALGDDLHQKWYQIAASDSVVYDMGSLKRRISGSQ
jgi:hypothetical protein